MEFALKTKVSQIFLGEISNSFLNALNFFLKKMHKSI